MNAYPFTISFTKRFTSGVLAGKTYHDGFGVVSEQSARQWLSGVDKNCRDYVVTEATVTNIETMKTTVLR